MSFSLSHFIYHTIWLDIKDYFKYYKLRDKTLTGFKEHVFRKIPQNKYCNISYLRIYLNPATNFLLILYIGKLAHLANAMMCNLGLYY